jgi:hypothetical protein
MYILWVGGRVARFFVTQYTKTGKKIPNNQRIPYVHKVCKITLKNSPYNMPTFCIPRPSKIYPNGNVWLEKKPSGNPGGWERTEFSLKWNTYREAFCVFCSRKMLSLNNEGHASKN